ILEDRSERPASAPMSSGWRGIRAGGGEKRWSGRAGRHDRSLAVRAHRNAHNVYYGKYQIGWQSTRPRKMGPNQTGWTIKTSVASTTGTSTVSTSSLWADAGR